MILDFLPAAKLALVNDYLIIGGERGGGDGDQALNLPQIGGNRRNLLFLFVFCCFESRSGYKDRPIGRFSPSPSVVWRSVLRPGD